MSEEYDRVVRVLLLNFGRFLEEFPCLTAKVLNKDIHMSFLEYTLGSAELLNDLYLPRQQRDRPEASCLVRQDVNAVVILEF